MYTGEVKVPTNISELLRKMRANADLMSRNFSFSCYQILMIYTTVKDASRKILLFRVDEASSTELLLTANE